MPSSEEDGVREVQRRKDVFCPSAHDTTIRQMKPTVVEDNRNRTSHPNWNNCFVSHIPG